MCLHEYKNGTQYSAVLSNNKAVQNLHEMYHTLTLFFNANSSEFESAKNLSQ